MARVTTYLNFMGQTEAAFSFYKDVFGTEYVTPISRIKDGPADSRGQKLTEVELNMVMHVALPILGGHVLMGTDMIASMGHTLVQGNNVHINLETDTKKEAERLFSALSVGGKVVTPLAPAFWGGYFGSLTDAYGIQWMFNCTEG